LRAILSAFVTVSRVLSGISAHFAEPKVAQSVVAQWFAALKRVAKYNTLPLRSVAFGAQKRPSLRGTAEKM